MDRRMEGFLNRLLEGRGPVEKVCLLKEVISRVLRFAGVNRVGQQRLIEELAAEYLHRECAAWSDPCLSRTPSQQAPATTRKDNRP